MAGHIKRRSAGSWTVVVDMGPDPGTGKRRQVWRTVKGTKRQAERLLTELLHQRDTGVDMPPGRVTVAEFLEHWLVAYAKPNVAPATLLQYEWAIRTHLAPAFGSVLLTKLRSGHIQTLYSRLDDQVLSASIILHGHRVPQSALAQSGRWPPLPTNPPPISIPPPPARSAPHR